jgi:enamine deaminase RidA (YjgF/YER057c/UK114 family)
MREAEGALAKLVVNLTIEDAVAKAFRDLSKALESMAIKWIKALSTKIFLTRMKSTNGPKSYDGEL